MEGQVLVGPVIDILQTVAILMTLGFSLWQWKKTRDTIRIDNFAKIIASMNELRDYRLDNPAVERALFDSRKDWSDDQIRRRVYAVMFANIFEWTYFSYTGGLIDKKQWESWKDTVKNVILSDPVFADLLLDRSVYTFSFDAHGLITEWMNEKRTSEA